MLLLNASENDAQRGSFEEESKSSIRLNLSLNSSSYPSDSQASESESEAESELDSSNSDEEKNEASEQRDQLEDISNLIKSQQMSCLSDNGDAIVDLLEHEPNQND